MFLLVYLTLFLSAFASGNYLRVCYYTNWSQYRPEPQTYYPGDIDVSLCDNFVFSFADMEGNQLAPWEWNDIEMYAQFNNHIHTTNPEAKTLLGVGGWTFNITKMTAMLETPENREEFVSTSITYLKTHGFDGLDLDFEYPGSRGSIPEDKERFTLLCQELRAAFDADVNNFLLTAAVAAGKDTIDNAYEIDKIAPELDYISLMAYDLQGAWNDHTGHNSPLYARDGTEGTDYAYLNQDWAVNYWIAGGCPREKLILGMALYGRCFRLVDPDNNGIGAPANGPCKNGTYTREAGFLAYFEVCPTIADQSGTVVWEPEQMIFYGYKEDTWIGYDDVPSLTNKVRYTIDQGLGGFMAWALDLDDFNGQKCALHTEAYPLLKAMNEEISASTTTATNPTTGEPITMTTGEITDNPTTAITTTEP